VVELLRAPTGGNRVSKDQASSRLGEYSDRGSGNKLEESRSESADTHDLSHEWSIRDDHVFSKFLQKQNQ
jgi:hypothetical protein